MKLYNFFRSGTSHRLRIALNLKGLDYEYVAVDLRTEEHLGNAFKAINPQGLVPALVADEQVLIQSPAIIEWLEERYPEPALLPADADGRARVRALAALVGCDIHPVNNRRILEYLRHTIGCDEAVVTAWCQTWIAAGFAALEALLAADPSRAGFCFGQAPSLADVYLIPQVESARRFGVDLSPYPNILVIDRRCAELDAFRRAAPLAQPDAPAKA
ncbi:maleylacetoacetate isomerase [Crenobacter sp. SG2303]|uniref:Maleylacetoacetate isomerase n=1 Tax=Crenobacter oryzisoli TaxID=3056844 RepID=A0ABT7XPD7_9NEIS|nr:maleylacetoacetate isomerase [Crenobacter sp. SG2303]MDN0075661.1 maleylacetoacetate isomerase [Crenobacter sp. SG2303]